MLQKPSEEKQREDIERVALELYHTRLLLGKPGDEHSDWAKAEQIVRSRIRTTLFASNRPLVKLRKPTQQAFKFLALDTPKWFLFSLPQLEWMKLLAVPLVIAAAGSIITGQIQRESNQNASLKAYFDKLEELTFEENLLAETPNEGAIVLARGRTVAALRELDLPRRTQLIDFLQASGLSQTKEDSVTPVISFKAQNLSGLDLSYVNLSFLDFQEANLVNANLEWAILERVNLQRATLWKINLKEAELWSANLAGADLVSANLEGASLDDANLEGASLISANLAGADLVSANLEGASLISANLAGAVNLTQAQLALAKLCFTTIPDGISLDPNRDCKKLGIDPETDQKRE